MSARIRFRSRITKKTCFFFLPSARIRLLPISGKKQSISRGKKKLPKKTNSFREIKNISSYVFFCLFFFVALINFFFKSSKVVFYFVALIDFFFLKCFFRPPSLDFGFFLIYNREIKQSGLTQQTQNICITFPQRRPNVFDVGSTLYTLMLNEYFVFFGKLNSGCHH